LLKMLKKTRSEKGDPEPSNMGIIQLCRKKKKKRGTGGRKGRLGVEDNIKEMSTSAFKMLKREKKKKISWGFGFLARKKFFCSAGGKEVNGKHAWQASSDRGIPKSKANKVFGPRLGG